MRAENLSKMIHYENFIIQHHELSKAFAEFLMRWNWEAHITLSFFRSSNSNTAIKDAKFLLKYCKSKFKKMKVAGVILFAVSPAENSHIHILLTSDQRYPQTLVLCSNCHRIVHRIKDEVLKLSDLKEIIASSVRCSAYCIKGN